MNSTSDFAIAPAAPDDVPAIFGLICGLADYEKLPHEVVGTPELLHRYLFDEPACGALVAKIEGEAVGYALYFTTFSTFLTRPGVHLEDLFVQPAHRGRGIGTALIKAVARLAVERGSGRLEWSVLDWNAPSIGFYESLGARMLSDWETMRVTGEALELLASPEN